ncbi:hypothetical protein BD309DRAFT_878909, partial [Dichomitus squalens]
PVVSQAWHIKASEPPKYKGNKGSDITLKQWLLSRTALMALHFLFDSDHCLLDPLLPGDSSFNLSSPVLPVELRSSLTLQKMGLWFRVQNITTDDNKITLALVYLEDGAHNYVEDYVETASNSGALGTWADFTNRLKAGYRQLALEKTAQTSLEEWCSKTHSTIIQFAENFHRYASKSGYTDVELIGHIDNQVGKNSQILTVITAMRQINPMLIPTK